MQQKLTPALVQQLEQDPASVQRLDCKSKGIEKVVGMETCSASLTRLDLTDNHLTEPDGIACLSHLRWLSLAGNRLTSAEALSACLKELPDLEVLNVGRNELSGKLSVGRLKKLKALIANGNQLERVAGLERCPELNTLILSHNAIAALGAVAKLNLSHNARLADAAPLKSLVGLEELRLNHCALAALPPELSGLRQLRILEAGGNAIASWDAVAVLATLPALRQVSLKGCPLASQPDYEARMRALVPHLQVLDNHRITEKPKKRRATAEGEGEGEGAAAAGAAAAGQGGTAAAAGANTVAQREPGHAAAKKQRREAPAAEHQQGQRQQHEEEQPAAAGKQHKQQRLLLQQEQAEQQKPHAAVERGKKHSREEKAARQQHQAAGPQQPTDGEKAPEPGNGATRTQLRQQRQAERRQQREKMQAKQAAGEPEAAAAPAPPALPAQPSPSSDSDADDATAFAKPARKERRDKAATGVVIDMRRKDGRGREKKKSKKTLKEKEAAGDDGGKGGSGTGPTGAAAMAALLAAQPAVGGWD